MPVNGVSTGHFVTGVTTTKKIFLTNGTIAHVLATLAIVAVKGGGINAHTTAVAVAKVFPPADSTKAAVGAVVGIFTGTHP